MDQTLDRATRVTFFLQHYKPSASSYQSHGKDRNWGNMDKQTMAQEADKEVHVSYTSSDGLSSAAETASLLLAQLWSRPFFFWSETNECSAEIAPLLNAGQSSFRLYS